MADAVQTPVPMTEWQRVVDALDVAVVVTDRTLQITYVNPKATELLGLSAAECTSRTSVDAAWDVISPDGTPVSGGGHPAMRALVTREPVRGVTLGVRRGNAAERVWILASAVPELDADGAIARIVVSFSDVDATQRALREQDALYQTVFRSMSEGIAVHDADGTIRATNPAAERVLGLTRAQIAGRAATDPRWQLVTAAGDPLDTAAIPSERVRVSGESVTDHIIGVHRPSGELAWLSVRADPLRSPDHERLVGVVATFTDVTRQRETQLALEATRARTQRVLDAIPGVVFQYLAPSGEPARLPFVAGRITEVLGMAPDDVQTHPEVLLRILSSGHMATIAQRLRGSATQTSVCDYDAPFTRPDGGTRWLRVHGMAEAVPNGLLCTGVILDVTDAHQMAEGLRRAQQREALGHLAAGVAHNFNNMLAVIIPNLELARYHLPDEARPLIDDAERAATRAAELVRRMLALGRADGTASDRIVDLVPLIAEVLDLCRQTFDQRIVIDRRVDLDTAPVRGEASALHQVILNLCINARDALAGREAPRIEVALEPSGTDEVLLHVTDSGCGMPPDVLRRIGEPFFTTKAPGQGTGLGIASAFQTIAEAGGSWVIDSNPGSGTTITVRFPLVRD
jgi:two-component system, cell cycle sensor histidine kinase and response regulator CckA